MEARVAKITAGTASEAIWLLEHPPLYTAGPSARPEDLTDPERFEVFRHQARRAVYVSRAGAAGGICDARSEHARARSAPVS